MEINKIIYNGTSSLEYNMYVSGDKAFTSPEKDYEKVSVPGRNGDLVFFNNRYKNVEITYNAIILGNQENPYASNISDIRNWLLSANGYAKLEDTYNPDEFRMACFSGPIEVDTLLLEAGVCELIFDCKPQRWLKIGFPEVPLTYEKTSSDLEAVLKNPTKFIANPLIRVYGDGYFYIGSNKVAIKEQPVTYEKAVTDLTAVLNNPTDFIAHPLIRVYGNGIFQIGGSTFEFRQGTEEQAEDHYIEVDRNIPRCYEILSNGVLVNRNANVTFDVDWPDLSPGDNEIRIPANGGVTKIEIRPRWFSFPFYVDIDTDILDCYAVLPNGVLANRNSNVTLVDHKWPTLLPGENKIRIPANGGVTKIEITPRWWKI